MLIVFCYNKNGDDMNKELLEELLTLALSTGADFAEIYYENRKRNNFNVTSSKLDNISSNISRGVGVRIFKDKEYFYSSSNIITPNYLRKMIRNLVKNIKDKSNKKVKLNSIENKSQLVKIPHHKFDNAMKKQILLEVDDKIRKTYKEVTQVAVSFLENSREFVVANSEGKYVKSNSCHTRYVCQVYTEKKGVKEKEFYSFGRSMGYEFLDEIDIIEKSLSTAKIAVEKLYAQDFKGGELPVVIAPGFGAVIFHEACGHGLEATSVAPKTSVFSNLKGRKIASDKVTLIDDGTIPGEWGSSVIDDEGETTKKNILIEKGILKNYLVDRFNESSMRQRRNGCGRRQSYNYAPTSRMSNTYLAPGNDTFEDMIKSIKLGVYCERMSGGSVNPATGDFNFAVDTAILIKDGKLTDRIKGITLIGNSLEVLKNVEMVSSDLVLSDGYCGSKSGMIHVTIGQPTIKISKILVGGK